MNLGGIYLESAVLIAVMAVLLPVLIAVAVCWLKKWPWVPILSLALLLGGVLMLVGLNLFHRPLFVAWHRWQNPVAPKSGCISYEPNVTQLHATYRMDRPAFDRWVAACPWKLQPCNTSGVCGPYDQKRLGFGTPEAMYATEMEPNGKQLRVYFENGTMYLAYYSM